MHVIAYSANFHRNSALSTYQPANKLENAGQVLLPHRDSGTLNVEYQMDVYLY